MDRIPSSEPTKATDLFGSGKHGYTETLPAPTKWRAPAANGVQEEIVRTIEAAGLVPSADDLGQLARALDAMLEAMSLLNYSVIESGTLTSGYQCGLFAEQGALARWFAFGGGNTHADFGVSADGVVWDETDTGANGQIIACCRAEFLDAVHRGIVAVGIDGGIYTTDVDDATPTLSVHTPPGSYADTYRAVAASATEVIAVGDTGAIHRSTDGTAWTSEFSSAEDIRGVAWNGTLFCAVGTNGFIRTSPTGTSGTWTARTAASSFADDFFGIVWDDRLELFVAFGDAGEIQTSPDGITWTRRNTGGVDITDGVVLNSRVVLLDGDDDYRYSLDGVTWATQPLSFGDTGSQALNGFGTDGRSLLAFGTTGSATVVLRHLQRPQIV